MKHFMTLLTLLLLTGTILFGCSEKEPNYADNLSCAELMDTLEKQIPVPFGYETYTPDQVRYYFESTEAHDDVCLRYSKQSENINELGIFHTSDRESRQALEAVIDRYLEGMQEDQGAFVASYAPEELPKLEQATYRSFGNYTVYVILDEKDQELVFETVEKLLTREAK